jgi:flagellar biosynthesis protein FliR
MGWIGVATLALLIVLTFAIKIFILDYMANSVKVLHVGGYSEYTLAYTKVK